jgi:hypothetical protein
VSKASILGRAATYRDLCEVPDGLVAEILDGDLWVSPQPVPKHCYASMMLTVELVPPFQNGNRGPGGWQLLSEVELHLGGDVVVPDVAGWRRDRGLRLFDHAHIVNAPDWVCEIVSKSTEKLDRGLKMRLYARERVGHLWFLDPRTRTLEVFKLSDGGWVPIQVFGGDEAAPAAPFETVPLALSHLWAEN